MAKKETSVVITGIGWIGRKECGSIKKKQKYRYRNTSLLHADLLREYIFLYQVKNFGRFNEVARRTCCAAALAFYDAGIPYSNERSQDMGIIGTNEAGALRSNISYFKDYVENGRTLARGNLFIYTLPTSPLAEAAIHFGCQGPLLYASFPQEQIPSLLCSAKDMILRGESGGMLAITCDEDEGICFVLDRQEDDKGARLCTFEDAVAISGKKAGLDKLIKEFSV